MGGVGSNGRILAGGWQSFGGKLGRVRCMDDVVGSSRIVRVLPEDWEEDRQCCSALVQTLFSRSGCPRQTQTVEETGVDIVGVLVPKLAHESEVITPTLRSWYGGMVLIHCSNGANVHLFPLCSGLDREPRL